MKNEGADQYQILLFYKYVTIENPEELASWVRSRAAELSLTGRALVAEEGINMTFEGSVENTEAFIRDIHANPLFSDMSIKRSKGTGDAFPRLSVKVRSEIVGTRFPKEMADPERKTAPRITPDELRTWYEEDKDFVVIDMRNDYEYRSGHFKNSINPGLEASRDLPEVLPKLEAFKDKKVLTVCTGGVRCEKMSAYLLSNGFTDVQQLEDGMHGYMEKYPGKDFLGTLYTFDKRKTMDFGGDREIVGRCHHCEAPTENYINCVNDFCHKHLIVCEACIEVKGMSCSDTCSAAILSV